VCLRDKVDTCMLHQLQRAVLWCLGKTGKTCKNPEAQEQLRKNARIVMLSRQSLGVNKEIKQLQREAGVPRHQVRTLVPSSQTRWGAEFEQVARNNLLRHAVEQSVDNFKRKSKGIMEAIVEQNISADECQRFVEDGVLNEFEMMWQLRALFPLHFFVFKQTASHLAAEANVEQVFSRAGQLSEVNLDPDTLADMVSIMVNKHAYKPSLKDIMDKYYEMFRGKNHTNKTDFFNRTEESDTDD
jgi:hypothetical protein